MNPRVIRLRTPRSAVLSGDWERDDQDRLEVGYAALVVAVAPWGTTGYVTPEVMRTWVERTQGKYAADPQNNPYVVWEGDVVRIVMPVDYGCDDVLLLPSTRPRLLGMYPLPDWCWYEVDNDDEPAPATVYGLAEIASAGR